MSLSVIMVGPEVVSTQQGYLTANQSQLDSNNISISLQSDTSVPGVKGNGFVIMDGSKTLTSVSGISTKHNWIEVLNQFAINYAKSDDDNGFYAWGQIVPETGEYLCKDCGYVGEFQAGDVFPICDVCQAGEPDGPCAPDEGFWEKI
jgi:hypothetical protein